MKTLTYDPGDGVEFWEAIRKLPGYPVNEIMPIKAMLFEIGRALSNHGSLEIGGRSTGSAPGPCDG